MGKRKCFGSLKTHKMTHYKTKQQLTPCGCSWWPNGSVFDSGRYTCGNMRVWVYLTPPISDGYWTGPPSPNSLSQCLSTSDKSWFKPRKHSGVLHCYSRYPLKIWLLTVGFRTRKVETNKSKGAKDSLETLLMVVSKQCLKQTGWTTSLCLKAHPT